MKKSQQTITLTTIYRVGKDGDGYVSDETGNNYTIPLHKSLYALNKDIVTVEIDPQTALGAVVAIIKRNKLAYRCVVTLSESGAYLALPTDPKDGNPIKIPGPETEGQLVTVSIDSWSEPRMGTVITRHEDSAGSIIISSAVTRGFAMDYEPEILAEVERLIHTPPTEDFERKDLTHLTTFTIDPATAKDFDDALSYDVIDGVPTYGVHIADVSYIVRTGSELDKMAQASATSVYLPGNTKHMLPPLLAESFCSLRPHELRKVMTVLFELDSNGIPRPIWIGPSTIQSQHRFTYEEVDEIFEQQGGILFDQLVAMNTVALHLEHIRKERGALFLPSSEVKPILDESGTPIRFEHAVRTQSHALVEEWMLTANEATAQKITELGRGIYRAHPSPTPDRLQDLATNVGLLGIKTSFKELSQTGGLTRLLDNLPADSTLHSMVGQMMAQTQEKAFYTTEHIPHSGLALDTYTHFTSPIRRYPDVLVHRAIKQQFSSENYFPYSTSELASLLEHATNQERLAQQAEREAIAIAAAHYFKNHLNKPLKAVIRSISKSGVFATETETLADGRINTFVGRTRANRFGDYFIDTKNKQLKDTKRNITYIPGQTVDIFVSEVNTTEGMITFQLL
jgi:ribonuclease R